MTEPLDEFEELAKDGYASPAEQVEQYIRTFNNGDELRDALPQMKVGTHLMYHGVLHEVVDAGPEQGHRAAAIPEQAESKVCRWLKSDGNHDHCFVGDEPTTCSEPENCPFFTLDRGPEPTGSINISPPEQQEQEGEEVKRIQGRLDRKDYYHTQDYALEDLKWCLFTIHTLEARCDRYGGALREIRERLPLLLRANRWELESLAQTMQDIIRRTALTDQPDSKEEPDVIL